MFVEYELLPRPSGDLPRLWMLSHTRDLGRSLEWQRFGGRLLIQG